MIGAALVVIVGWFISGFLANLIEHGLKAVSFELAVGLSGIGDFLRRSGTTLTISGVIATRVKYFIFLIFVTVAADIIGILPNAMRRASLSVSFFPRP